MLTVRGCELLWDVETADEVQRIVEAANGGCCPCFADERCPLLPEGFRLIDAEADVAVPG